MKIILVSKIKFVFIFSLILIGLYFIFGSEEYCVRFGSIGDISCFKDEPIQFVIGFIILLLIALIFLADCFRIKRN